MATFPALKPSGRTFTPGDYPNTPFKAWSGREGRVRHSNVMLESTLRLTFTGINETQMLSILTHYQGQRGGFESFALPNDVWSGVTTVSDYSLTGYRWCYTEPPTVTDLPCGNHIVELSLATVPPEGVSLNGLSSLVAVLIGGGDVAVSNGLAKSITWTLTPGQFFAEGLNETITTSIDGGVIELIQNGITASVTASITGGAVVVSDGLDLSIQASINGGAAIVEFISYPNFASTTGLSLVSTAGVTNDFLYLTNTTQNDVGNVWTSTSRTYDSNFSVRWQFECSGGNNGNGFTLQWHTANNVTGSNSSNKGRVLNSNCIHAITFDTPANPDTVRWHKNNVAQGSLLNSTISGGWRQNVYYWFDYDHALSQAKLYYSTSSTKPASASHTFNSFSFDGTAYYMGFGAGTSNLADNHILKAWFAI